MWKIPINETRNQFQFYTNDNGYKIKINNIRSLNDIRVKLLYPDNTIINVNNVPFSFDLVFYEWNKMISEGYNNSGGI